jgi:hypothetical protein
MRLFVLRVELANVVTVQCLHDADPRAQAMPVAPVLLDQISHHQACSTTVARFKTETDEAMPR